MSNKEIKVIDLLKITDYMTIDCLLIFISPSTFSLIDLNFNNPLFLYKISIDQDSNAKKFIVQISKV